MLRIPRFSLAQTLLLVALAAFLTTLGVDIYRNRSFITANAPVLRLAPDGKTLAMNCSFRPLFHRRHPVILLNAEDLSAPPRFLESHAWVLGGLAWSNDSQRLYSQGGGTIQVWDVSSGDSLKKLEEDAMNSLAVSSDERFVACGAGSNNPIVSVRDIDTGDRLEELKGHKRWVWSAGFTPGDKYLATCCIDGDLCLWEKGSWRLVCTLKCRAGEHGLVFTPDGKLLDETRRPKANGPGQDVGVAVRDLPSGNIVDEFWIKDTNAAVSSIAISKDGKYLAAAHGGSEAHSGCTIWDFETKRELATIELNEFGEQWITAMEFSLDGQTLFCADDRANVFARNWRNGTSTQIFDRPAWPWRFALIGTLIWGCVWRFVPRLPKAKVATPSTTSTETVGAG